MLKRAINSFNISNTFSRYYPKAFYQKVGPLPAQF